MTTRFHVGAKDLRGDIAAYAKRFDLLEVPLGAHVSAAPSAKTVAKGTGAAAKGKTPGKKTPPGPNLATMRRWRKQVPPAFDFCVVLGPTASRLKPSPDADAEVAAALQAVDVLQARALLIKTPVEVTPGPVWRKRLEAMAERLRREPTHLVWQPSGVWEIEDAAVLARQIGLVLVVDAARDPVPGGPVAYVRLPSLGETRSYGSAALERVIDAVGTRRDAYVVLETDGALTEAKKLRSLAQRSRSGAKGGMARIVRPRGGGVLVRDDEQE
jgi:uncharacterized protein YecE (DUF72 family)